jgi:chromate reductase
MPDTTIATILGSLRRSSYHRVIAETLPELAPAGVLVQPPAPIDLPLYDGDIEAAGIPETVQNLGETIAKADALIFVTPEYNHSIPGVLKNAIDWLSRLKSRPLQNKPAAIISGSPGARGGAHAQDHLRPVLTVLRVRVLEEPRVVIPALTEKVDLASGRVSDEPTRELIRAQLAALAALAAPQDESRVLAAESDAVANRVLNR